MISEISKLTAILEEEDETDNETLNNLEKINYSIREEGERRAEEAERQNEELLRCAEAAVYRRDQQIKDQDQQIKDLKGVL